MANVLELFEEAISVARELGFMVREEPLGDLPGGACMANGKKQLLLNASMSPADQLDVLLKTIGGRKLMRTRLWRGCFKWEASGRRNYIRQPSGRVVCLGTTMIPSSTATGESAIAFNSGVAWI